MTFLKNSDLLNEDSKVDDLLDFSAHIERFNAKIKEITFPAIVALVGKFGTGKSTMLHQMQKADKENTWILFDAWKYPDRKDLWEGFVLDFAHQIGKRDKIKNKMEGNLPAISMFKSLGGIAAGLYGISIIKETLDSFINVFRKSPATRIFEIQAILKELIESQKGKGIIFVLEDIDRSGESGMHFLETLKQFLQTLDKDKKIIAIAPVSDTHYNKEENKDLYLKCVDYTEIFELGKVKLTHFVEGVFKEELLGKDDGLAKEQLIEFLETMFGHNITTMRELKFFLRQCDNVYKCQEKLGLNPDFRISICFETTKHFKKNKRLILTYGYDKNGKSIIKPNDSFAFLFLTSVALKRSIDKSRDFSFPNTQFFLETHEKYKLEWQHIGWNNNNLFVFDFYKEYQSISL